MPFLRLFLFACVLALGPLCAQNTQVNLGAQSKNADFSAFTVTKPMAVGTSLPGACTSGSFFFIPSTSTAYACGAGNTWTAVSGGLSDPGSNGIVERTGVNTTTALAAPAGALVGTTANQALTNKQIQASEITSGTLLPSVLPLPTSSSIGGVQSLAFTSSYFLTSITTSGVVTAARPAFTDILGVLGAGQFPSLTGDMTSSGLSVVLNTVNSNVGTFGSSTNCPIVTVNAKGLITAASQVACASGPGGGATITATTNIINGDGAGNGVNSGIAVNQVVPLTNAALAVSGAGANGISNAVAAAGTTNPAEIWAPPAYPATEALPCTYANINQMVSNDGCAYLMSPNITVNDTRHGPYEINVDSYGLFGSTSNYWATTRQDTYFTRAFPNGSNYWFASGVGLDTNLVALHGGQNVNVGSFSSSPYWYPNKSFYIAHDVHLQGYTPGQKIGVQSFVNSFATGDALGFYAINTCYGGFSGGSDEGCEAMDVQAHQGTIEYRGAVQSTGSPNTNNVTVLASTGVGSNTSAGDGTQGEGRFLVDTSQAYTTGTLYAFSGGGPTVVTGAGTFWPVSSVNTTTTQIIGAPTGSPATITLNSLTNISNGTLLCVADPYEIEQVVASSVGSPSGTITATFRYPHPSGAIVAAGGLACQFLQINADTALPSQYPNLTIALQNSLHYVIPIIVSTSATSLQLWNQSPDNGWATYRGQWSSTNNGYAIYPGAAVTSVMQGQKLSSDFTIEVPVASLPTNTFLATDTVMMPLYHNQSVNAGIISAQRVFPSAQGGNPAALYMSLTGLWYKDPYGYKADTAIEADNVTPTSVYCASGQCKQNGASGSSGILIGPDLIKPTGVWDNLIYIQTPPGMGAIAGVGNPNNIIRSDDSTVAYNLLFQSNGSNNYMGIQIDPINQRIAFLGPGYGSSVSAAIYPQTGMYQETFNPPSSSSAACTTGQFTDGVSSGTYYHFVCVSSNVWQRVALSTF